MTVITELRKSVQNSQPVLALVGVTDLAVENVRKVAANASDLQTEVETRMTKAQEELEKTIAGFDPAAVQKFVVKQFDPKTLQANASQVPALAVSRALELAGQVESAYEAFAARGKKLVDRVESQKATQDLIAQGKATLSRSKAAVTTARKAVDETTSSALGLVSTGRKGVVDAVTEAVAEVQAAVTGTEKTAEKAAEKAAATTRAAAKKTATTARKQATATRSAAKGAATSARKTATKAAKAAEAAAAEVGD